ncbi:MAG: gamma-glutamylcyclotransferase [Amphiplicatus sp.]
MAGEIRGAGRIGGRGRADYLFVYGTLRRGAGAPLAARLARQAVFIGPGRFRGRLYLAKRYPAAIDSADPGDVVHGDLYRIGDDPGLIAALDAYEGFDPAALNRGGWRRCARPVECARRCICAWIYLYDGFIDETARIEGGDYLVARQAGRRSRRL